MTPTLYLLAGGNGAGKSTFYRQQLQQHGTVFVNADELAKHVEEDDPDTRNAIAWNRANEMREQLLAEGKTFAYETVFSHPSKLEFIERARANGHHVVLIYIHLSDPQLNVARVKIGHQAAERHDVPEDKIRSRLEHVPDLLKSAIEVADEALVFDNSSADNPFLLVAQYQGGALIQGQTPPWLI